MDIIKERLAALEGIVREHPLQIPVKVVAKFLGVNEEGLKVALMRGNAPFGFAYQKADGGYRVPVIPTITFYLWYTNTTGQEVMSADQEFCKHPIQR